MDIPRRRRRSRRHRYHPSKTAPRLEPALRPRRRNKEFQRQHSFRHEDNRPTQCLNSQCQRLGVHRPRPNRKEDRVQRTGHWPNSMSEHPYTGSPALAASRPGRDNRAYRRYSMFHRRSSMPPEHYIDCPDLARRHQCRRSTPDQRSGMLTQADREPMAAAPTRRIRSAGRATPHAIHNPR